MVEVKAAQILLVVEGTAMNGPYLPELLSTYIIPLLEQLTQLSLKEYNAFTETPYMQFGIVIYHASDRHQGLSPESYGPFCNPCKVISVLRNYEFAGGRGEACAHIAAGLATALQCFEDFQSKKEIDSTPEKYCILVCNSPPYEMPYFGLEFSGKTASELAAMLNDHEIKLSILAPRRIPALFKLFEMAGGNVQENLIKSSAKDPRHMVLLQGFSLGDQLLGSVGLCAEQLPQCTQQNTLPAQKKENSELVSSSVQPVTCSTNTHGQNSFESAVKFPNANNPTTDSFGSTAHQKNVSSLSENTYQKRQQTMNVPTSCQVEAPTVGPSNSMMKMETSEASLLNQQHNIQSQHSQPSTVSQVMPMPPPQHPSCQSTASTNTAVEKFSDKETSVVSQTKSSVKTRIWEGYLEWFDKLENDEKVVQSLPCSMSTRDSDMLESMSPSFWPKKLTLKIIPKRFAAKISSELLENSRKIMVDFEECPLLEELIRKFNTENVGYIQFVCENARGSENIPIKLMMMFFSQPKKTFFCVIPNDQSKFILKLQKALNARGSNKQQNQQPVTSHVTTTNSGEPQNAAQSVSQVSEKGMVAISNQMSFSQRTHGKEQNQQPVTSHVTTTYSANPQNAAQSVSQVSEKEMVSISNQMSFSQRTHGEEQNQQPVTSHVTTTNSGNPQNAAQSLSQVSEKGMVSISNQMSFSQRTHGEEQNQQPVTSHVTITNSGNPQNAAQSVSQVSEKEMVSISNQMSLSQQTHGEEQNQQPVTSHVTTTNSGNPQNAAQSVSQVSEKGMVSISNQMSFSQRTHGEEQNQQPVTSHVTTTNSGNPQNAAQCVSQVSEKGMVSISNQMSFSQRTHGEEQNQQPVTSHVTTTNSGNPQNAAQSVSQVSEKGMVSISNQMSLAPRTHGEEQNQQPVTSHINTTGSFELFPPSSGPLLILRSTNSGGPQNATQSVSQVVIPNSSQMCLSQQTHRELVLPQHQGGFILQQHSRSQLDEIMKQEQQRLRLQAQQMVRQFEHNSVQQQYLRSYPSPVQRQSHNPLQNLVVPQHQGDIRLQQHSGSQLDEIMKQEQQRLRLQAQQMVRQFEHSSVQQQYLRSYPSPVQRQSHNPLQNQLRRPQQVFVIRSVNVNGQQRFSLHSLQQRIIASQQQGTSSSEQQNSSSDHQQRVSFSQQQASSSQQQASSSRQQASSSQQQASSSQQQASSSQKQASSSQQQASSHHLSGQ